MPQMSPEPSTSCTYCSRPFGATVSWRGRALILCPVREHVIPKAVGGRVVVPACQLCNRIKGSLVFGSLVDIQGYCLDVLTREGSALLDGPAEPFTSRLRASLCEECGEPMYGKRVDALFCTDACRSTNWTRLNPTPIRRERTPVQRSLIGKPCATCGTEHHRESRYCSDACKARDWRETRETLHLPMKPPPKPPDILLPVERKRLGKQQERILARLAWGRTSNAELARIAIRYSARIKELKDRGHDIRLVQRDHATGLTVYALFLRGVESREGKP